MKATIENLQKPFYKYNGIKGVLLYLNEVKECDENIEPLEDNGSVGFYDFASIENLIELIRSGKIDVCSTYTSSYSSIEENGEEIDIYTMQNLENEQTLIHNAWETIDSAKCDEFNREICTKTNKYYDWTSELSSFIDGIDEHRINTKKYKKEKEKEWKKICAAYSDPFGNCEIPTIEDIFSEI